MNIFIKQYVIGNSYNVTKRCHFKGFLLSYVYKQQHQIRKSESIENHYHDFYGIIVKIIISLTESSKFK